MQYTKRDLAPSPFVPKPPNSGEIQPLDLAHISVVGQTKTINSPEIRSIQRWDHVPERVQIQAFSRSRSLAIPFQYCIDSESWGCIKYAVHVLLWNPDLMCLKML
ncbi:hypothetical protein DR999_PMT13847 [Platysternon megacephalum]|uniref:Uncharacterized protein n=1 Tax=Platysternon megacephalum TaxID=55544 RepID=A0A4D9E2P4_9SAUR|nr:hypothetical protein DR999_PMT13847 [Platysternon megacephalum]